MILNNRYRESLFIQFNSTITMTYLTTTAPCIRFTGPEGGILYQKDPSGQRTPRFSVDKVSSKEQRIDRITPDGFYRGKKVIDKPVAEEGQE